MSKCASFHYKHLQNQMELSPLNLEKITIFFLHEKNAFKI